MFFINIFKKSKPVITTDDSKNRLNSLVVSDNKRIINEIVDEIIQYRIDKLKANVKKPFEAGDFVTPIYTTGHCGSYYGTGKDLITNFGDVIPELNAGVSLKVLDCLIVTQQFKDKVECIDFDYYAHLDYTGSNPRNYHRAWIINAFKKIEPIYAVTIDWDFHKFKFPPAELRHKDNPNEKPYLCVRWGGLAAHSFVLSDSDRGNDERTLAELNSAYRKARATYEHKISEIENKWKK